MASSAFATRADRIDAALRAAFDYWAPEDPAPDPQAPAAAGPQPDTTRSARRARPMV